MLAVCVVVSTPLLAACPPLDALTQDAGVDADASRALRPDGGSDAHAEAAAPAMPVVLASGLHQPQRIVASGQTVFWTDPVSSQSNDQGLVMACAREGCGNSPAVIASGQEGPWAIEADATNVYFSTVYGFPAVTQCPRAGCGTSPTILFQFPPPPNGLPDVARALAVDSSAVYWTMEVSGTVYRCPIGGCSLNPTALQSGSSQSVKWAWGIAVDASTVYWVEGDGVWDCPLAGCGGVPRLLASLQPSSTEPDRYLAASTSQVFWTLDDSGTVSTVPKGLGKVSTIASSQDHPADVATDGTFVYWSNAGSGTIARAPVGGGSMEILATGQNDVQGIAVDDRYVYWTLAPQTGNGAVVRLDK